MLPGYPASSTQTVLIRKVSTSAMMVLYPGLTITTSRSSTIGPFSGRSCACRVSDTSLILSYVKSKLALGWRRRCVSFLMSIEAHNFVRGEGGRHRIPGTHVVERFVCLRD